jgi:hypothetical protein
MDPFKSGDLQDRLNPHDPGRRLFHLQGDPVLKRPANWAFSSLPVRPYPFLRKTRLDSISHTTRIGCQDFWFVQKCLRGLASFSLQIMGYPFL